MAKTLLTIISVLLVFLSTQLQAEARIQVVHAAAVSEEDSQTAASVQVDDTVLVSEIRFGGQAGYSSVPAGERTITVSSAIDGALLAESVSSLEADVDYTLVVAGDGEQREIELLLLEDAVSSPGSGRLILRVIHAGSWEVTPSDELITLRTAAGEPFGELETLAYLDDTGFQSVPAGDHDLKFTSFDGMTNVVDFEPVEWLAGVRRTLVVMGDGVRQPKSVVSIPGGRLEMRVPVDNSVTGWWESALGGNEGFIMQPIPAQNRLVGTIYTWDTEGLGEPLWFTFDTCSTPVGDADCVTPGAFAGTQANAAVYRFAGGVIGDTLPADGFIAGTVSIEFLDCNNAEATVQLDNFGEVTWNLSRLTATMPCNID